MRQEGAFSVWGTPFFYLSVDLTGFKNLSGLQINKKSV